MAEKNKDMPSKGFSEILSNGLAFELILVEGGTFLMGSEEEEANARESPVHRVELDGFYMSKYPITQALWKTVMGGDNNPSSFKGDNRPVERVSWEDTQLFFRQLNDATGKAYRLPMETEWEYAARGGKQNEGYKYAGSDRLKEVGWYAGNSYGETKPVGMKAPNGLSIYDMSGNVREWCEDWFDENYYEECHKLGTIENPQGPAAGTYRVLRGGSWNTDPLGCRCTFRSNSSWPVNRYINIGFRLVLPFQSAG